GGRAGSGTPEHTRDARDRRRGRPDDAVPAVSPLGAEAGLLRVNDVRLDGPHNVVAQAPALQHARREAFRDDIRLRDQALGDRQALRVTDVERDAALARAPVVELPALVYGAEVGRQRPGGGLTRRPAA